MVDGIWQISGNPVDIQVDAQYGKMTIRTVDATNCIITMDNKDNPITLERKSDIELMPGVHIRTADNDTHSQILYIQDRSGGQEFGLIPKIR